MLIPEQMIPYHYYTFRTYDEYNIPSKMFGRFLRKHVNGNYLFDKVVVNADAGVAEMHGLEFRHPNYKVINNVEIWPDNIRGIQLVPSGATLFIYSLLNAQPDVGADSIEPIVESLNSESDVLSPKPEDYGMIRPTKERNSFGGKTRGSFSKKHNRKSRKRRQR